MACPAPYFSNRNIKSEPTGMYKCFEGVLFLLWKKEYKLLEEVEPNLWQDTGVRYYVYGE